MYEHDGVSVVYGPVRIVIIHSPLAVREELVLVETLGERDSDREAFLARSHGVHVISPAAEVSRQKHAARLASTVDELHVEPVLVHKLPTLFLFIPFHRCFQGAEIETAELLSLASSLRQAFVCACAKTQGDSDDLCP